MKTYTLILYKPASESVYRSNYYYSDFELFTELSKESLISYLVKYFVANTKLDFQEIGYTVYILDKDKLVFGNSINEIKDIIDEAENQAIV